MKVLKMSVALLTYRFWHFWSLCVCRSLRTSRMVALWIGGRMVCCSTRCWLDRWGKISIPPTSQKNQSPHYIHCSHVHYSGRSVWWRFITRLHFITGSYLFMKWKFISNLSLYTLYSCTWWMHAVISTSVVCLWLEGSNISNQTLTFYIKQKWQLAAQNLT